MDAKQKFEQFCKENDLDIERFPSRSYLTGEQAYVIISGAFIWDTQPEGRDYWSNINIKWRKYLESKITPEPISSSTAKLACTCKSIDLFRFGCKCGGV